MTTCFFISLICTMIGVSIRATEVVKYFRPSEISPWTAYNKKHRTLAEAGLGQNGLTVFCIRHRQLLAAGQFSVSSDSPLWYFDTWQSIRRARGVPRDDVFARVSRVSDLEDLDEISSSYADRISDTQSRGLFGTSTCRRWSNEIHRK